jgi:glycerophosphoryl diester phosphodiesterase
MKKIRAIGHRGCGVGKLENTLRSFREAITIGVDGIEFDVHATSDGEIVVIHDPNLERTTNGVGFIQQKTLAQLKKLDAGDGETIPTLQEVIEEATGPRRILLNIEIKPPDIEQQVLNIVKEYDIMDQVIVSSFLLSALKVIRSLDREIATGLLYSYSLDDPVKLAKELGASALHPLYTFVTGELVKQSRKAGLLINPWVVNEESDMQRLIEFGVDSIITDSPMKLVKMLR